MVVKFKAHVLEADKEDKHKGWIKVSENLRGGIPSAAYVKLMANNRKVYCQVRGTPGKVGCTQINEWYRNALGWYDDPPTGEINFVMKRIGFCGRILAWSWHPDDIVRVAIGLGIISVGLGLLGVILSFLPASIRVMASSDLSDSVVGMVSLAVGSGLGLVVILCLSTGLWIFLRQFPKPIKRKDS